MGKANDETAANVSRNPEELKISSDSTKICIPNSSPEVSRDSHYPKRQRKRLIVHDSDVEDEEDPDDDYADLEHDFDNDENEEALL